MRIDSVDIIIFVASALFNIIAAFITLRLYKKIKYNSGELKKVYTNYKKIKMIWINRVKTPIFVYAEDRVKEASDNKYRNRVIL